MDASASSQFISALLLAGARYDEGVTVHHDGKPVPSEPHILMTVETLRDAGAIVDDSEPNTWRVEPSEINALDVSVEPDLSNAGPFVAAALVAGGTVRVPGWPQHTTQAGDLLREILDTMGADVRLDRSGLTVIGSGELVGIDIDLHDAAELTPTVAALAALASTPTWIRGVAHIRGHETDRLAALTAELGGLGARGDRDRGRPAHRAGALARRAVPQLPRPPDGHRGRDHRPARAGRARRGHRHDAQDPPRLRRPVAGHARRLRPGGAGSMSWRDLDEGDIRVRPSRKGSRPRTKERPAHVDAVVAMVIGVDRGRYTCLIPKGSLGKKEPERVVTAMKAREIGRTRVVVGDDVALVGDLAGGPDALARIVRIEERRSVLRRTADDTDPYERIIVANADQLVIVTALADPEPRPRMVDRCLVAAYDADLEPLLALTKADLVDPTEFLANYTPLEVEHVVTSWKDGDFSGLDALRAKLSGKVSVLVGHSGVGKSTLVNGLVPGALRATGIVNDTTGRGRHTSTNAVALRLRGADGSDDGWVIDTPGIRSFGLAHIDVDHIIDHFPDLAAGTDSCPRGCTHDEEECALDAWVAEGHAGPAGASRLESLRRLLSSRSTTEDH